MTWKRKVDDRRAEQPLRVRARVTQVVGLGEDACQVAAAVRVEVLQGLAREVSLAGPTGLVVNQVNGATVADWEIERRPASRQAARADRHRSVVRRLGRRAGRRATARSTCRSCACRPPSAKPAASRSTSPAPARSAGGRRADFEPADPSELGDLVAGRESPSMIAFRHRPLAGTEARALTVGVVRYTPQAVFIANVEEARYRALASEDGRLLVEARYAVRNNQRSFLKATLPRGIDRLERRGRRPSDSAGRRRSQCAILLPLEKGRAGDEAPTFVVELVYLAARSTRGRTRATRASNSRRSICRSRAPASSCTTRRAFASSRSPDRFASTAIRVRSRRRCAAPPPPRCVAGNIVGAIGARRRTAGAGRSLQERSRRPHGRRARCRSASSFRRSDRRCSSPPS